MVELLAKLTQLVLQLRLVKSMADRKTVPALMWFEEGTDRDRCLKRTGKENYYIKVPAILDDGGDA